MRKIILAILIFVLLSFFIPIIFSQKFNNTTQVNVENIDNKNNPQIVEYDYEQYGKVKLLHTNTNQIEELNIDEYLYGVVSAEMPADFELEALKAQAIVARTYTIYKIIQNVGKHENADICDNSACCQAWISKEDRLNRWAENKEENWNKIVSAVELTKGQIITYEGQPINAFFHSNSGGTTEVPLNVWGGTGYPYLQSVSTSGESDYTQYSSEVTISKTEFTEKIKVKYPEFSIDFSSNDCIKILEYTEGGRIKTIKIGNLELSGVEVRTLIGLKSANFEISIQEDNLLFKVIGYGHGVGMSQTGADSLAKQGYTFEQIIKHFYTGVEITNI